MRSACWALEKGISVVICNGMAENAVRSIMSGRKLGTFFTRADAGTLSVETAAEQGNPLSTVDFVWQCSFLLLRLIDW